MLLHQECPSEDSTILSLPKQQQQQQQQKALSRPIPHTFNIPTDLSWRASWMYHSSGPALREQPCFQVFTLKGADWPLPDPKQPPASPVSNEQPFPTPYHLVSKCTLHLTQDFLFLVFHNFIQSRLYLFAFYQPAGTSFSTSLLIPVLEVPFKYFSVRTGRILFCS